MYIDRIQTKKHDAAVQQSLQKHNVASFNKKQLLQVNSQNSNLQVMMPNTS